MVLVENHNCNVMELLTRNQHGQPEVLDLDVHDHLRQCVNTVRATVAGLVKVAKTSRQRNNFVFVG